MPRIVSIVFGLVALHGSSTIAHAATKVACVGDSITENSGWCAALGTKLGANYQVGNFGVSGTTLMKSGDTPYWTSRQYTPGHDFAPNIVVIMLGTNDSKPQNWSKKANFVADYTALIDSYAVLASNPKIYVCLPPPAGNNSYAISGTVIANEVLPLVREVAISKNVPTIDIFSAFGGTSFDASLFDGTQDQVHPNAKGAQLICDKVYAAVTATVPMGTGGAGGAGGAGAGANFGGSATGGRTNSGGSTHLAGSFAAAGRSDAGGRANAAGNASRGGNANTGGALGGAGATSVGGRSNGGGSTDLVGGSSFSGAAISGGQPTTTVATNTGGIRNSGGQSSATIGTSSGGAVDDSGLAILGGTSSSSKQADAGSPSSDAVDNQNSTPGASGCGCRTRGGTDRNRGWVALLLAAIALRRSRRVHSKC